MGKFQIRKIYKDGTLSTENHGSEGELDNHTIEQLYIPVKKYFIKKYEAPIALSVHYTRHGIPCLDFIGDARVPEDFSYDRVIKTYRKVVKIFVKSDYSVTNIGDFKTNIGPCIAYLSGDKEEIKVNNNHYNERLFALVK
ncbi:hypothetical protein IKE83_02270, partial [Candidatus Saccharibacteria bacterium]|nr:hypothetical protein [Candidatus Saccharibacteria bacterium]